MASLGSLVFYGLAVLAVASAATVAFARNILHAALGLLAALLAVAALYLWLGADFLGVTQLLIYVGGVLVLFLFAVLLTSRIGDVRLSNGAVGRKLAVPVVAAAVVGLAAVLISTRFALTEAVAAPTTARIGDGFLREYLLPFELASVVLLVALVAAMVLVRRSARVPGSVVRATPSGGQPRL